MKSETLLVKPKMICCANLRLKRDIGFDFILSEITNSRMGYHVTRQSIIIFGILSIWLS